MLEYLFNKVADFVSESLFDKVAGRQANNFLVNISEFLRTTFFKEHLRWLILTLTDPNLMMMMVMMMMMMMMMMNCFCEKVDRRRLLSSISRPDHCRKFAPALPQRAVRGLEPAENLISSVAQSFTLVVTITQHIWLIFSKCMTFKPLNNYTA